jgi:hypothetical protein
MSHLLACGTSSCLILRAEYNTCWSVRHSTVRHSTALYQCLLRTWSTTYSSLIELGPVADPGRHPSSRVAQCGLFYSGTAIVRLRSRVYSSPPAHLGHCTKHCTLLSSAWLISEAWISWCLAELPRRTGRNLDDLHLRRLCKGPKGSEEEARPPFTWSTGTPFPVHLCG